MQLRLTDDSVKSHARLLWRLQIPVIVLMILTAVVIYSPVRNKTVIANAADTTTVPVSLEAEIAENAVDFPNPEAEEAISPPNLESASNPSQAGIDDSDPTKTTIEARREKEVTTTQTSGDVASSENSLSNSSEDKFSGDATSISDQIGQLSAPIKEKLELANELRSTLVRGTWQSAKQATAWIKKAKPTAALPAGLVIRNHNANRGSVAFLFDKEVKNLAPGEEFQIDDNSLHTIRFHRGGDFGQAKVEVQTGIYLFELTKTGWDLAPEKIE